MFQGPSLKYDGMTLLYKVEKPSFSIIFLKQSNALLYTISELVLLINTCWLIILDFTTSNGVAPKVPKIPAIDEAL